MKAFFIVGVQRSGTTLLAEILSKHPEVLMEPRSIAFRLVTCFNNLYDLLPYNLEYEESEVLSWLIENDENGRLADLLDYRHTQDYSTIRELIDHSISSKLREADTIYWGDKSPNLQHFVPDILTLIPNAKFIHIIRDGRAVAASMNQRAFRHLQLAAQEWVDGNIYGLVNQQKMGVDHYLIISYEALLQDPESVLQKVCAFLDLPFVKGMLNLDNKGVPEEKNYVKSFFDQSKIMAWQQQLTAEEIKRIETIQGPLLTKLDYQLIHPVSGNPHRPLSRGRRIYYNQLDNVKQLFRSKQTGMRDRKNIELKIPLKSRLYAFIRVLCQDLVALPIFKTWFSRVFYKEKYYRKPTERNEKQPKDK